ncbi:response regulator transcription factor [Paenibacillus kobensis]|uniref:response regulator transcription factor n=1 Tax=Paenibacillus kobensis TaxID=59841 RepID=UPI000FDB5581|nr:response regulator [Paenibacillus kobensis]
MSKPGAVCRILIADDEMNTREGIRYLLEHHYAGNWSITTAEHGLDAWEKLQSAAYDLLIADIRMPGMTGLELVGKLMDSELDTAVVLLSGYAEFEYAQQGLQYGVADYLLKPAEPERLIESIEKALGARARRRLERQAYAVWTIGFGEEEAQARNGHSNMHPSIAKAIGYMQERLNEPMSMREVAQYVHLSPSYFSALFKDVTELTFSDYMIRLRHRRAKELLVKSELDILQIADEIGYQSSSYFIRVFRELEGVTPGQFRESIHQLASAATIRDC